MHIQNFLDRLRRYFFWAIIFELVLVLHPAFSMTKGVILTPPRIILEGKERATTVKIVNPDDKPYSFKISITFTKMNEDGSLSTSEAMTDKEKLTEKMIRFSPRRATIPPNGWQTLRLMVRKPKDLPPGEYRAQLRVSPVDTPDGSAIENKNQAKGLGIDLNFVFSISTPIIIRHGDVSEPNIIPQQPKLVSKGNKNFIVTNLERKGPFSAYLNLEAFFTPSGGTNSQKIKVSEQKGFAIYTDVERRVIELPVEAFILSQMNRGGELEIQIRNAEKQSTPIICSKTFELY